MDLYAELFKLVEALEAAGLPYAVCGGIAVAIHGYPRFTQDIDLLILPSDEKRVLSVAEKCQFTVDGGRLPMGEGKESHWEIVRVSKIVDRDLLPLDLMLVAPEIQSTWDDRAVVEFSGRRVCVVSRPGLKHLKQLSGRRKDLLDLEELGLDDAPLP